MSAEKEWRDGVQPEARSGRESEAWATRDQGWTSGKASARGSHTPPDGVHLG
jgi:hypothetical protein